jgi:nucleotide-binding universal stress UspA family protein
MQREGNQNGSRGDERTVVVGIDGSEHSRQALKWAADEAKRRRAFLKIVFARIEEPEHVPAWYQPGASGGAPAQAVIDDAYGLVATRHPSVVARAETVEWPPARVLTMASRSADLVVVGARGHGGFDELLLGSVSDQCIQYAHCPVVVVHADPDALPLRAAEPRIVVGIDGSLGSSRALKWALEEAQLRSASVEVVYAWQYPPIGAFVLGPVNGYEVAAEEIVHAATGYATHHCPDVPFTSVLRFEAAVPALLDASRHAELLVTGSKGHGGFEHALLGSVAHQCARHATCAVAVARPVITQGEAATVTSISHGAGRPVRPGRSGEQTQAAAAPVP